MSLFMLEGEAISGKQKEEFWFWGGSSKKSKHFDFVCLRENSLGVAASSRVINLGLRAFQGSKQSLGNVGKDDIRTL